MNVLGIDIGGSALKGAPVDTTTGKLLGERCRISTEGKLLTPAQMARAAGEIARHFKWKGPVGIGFPGVITGSTIRTSANLHRGFVDCDGRALFRPTLGRQVALTNDADAAGLAEVTFGAGRKRRGTILLLTFGTGVGSALFVDGRLYPNSELGHLPFKGGDAERRVSAAAKEKKNLSYKRWGRRVSDYLNILEAVLWPELIIVGGGISADADKWFRYLKLRTPIVPARFLNEAGIVGAALNAALKFANDEKQAR